MVQFIFHQFISSIFLKEFYIQLVHVFNLMVKFKYLSNSQSQILIFLIVIDIFLYFFIRTKILNKIKNNKKTCASE